MEFKFKLLGYPIQFRLEVVIAAVLLGMFIQGNMAYNCLTQEGMDTCENFLGLRNSDDDSIYN